MDNDDVIDTINKLVETSKDGEYGFGSCAEHCRTAALKQVFTARAQECQQAAVELQTLVAQLGGTAEDGGSTTGAVHRGWVAVRGTLAGYSDQAMLDECERGEDTALARYRDALQENLPPSVRTIVERQFEGVKRNHLQIRTLRDQHKAASA